MMPFFLCAALLVIWWAVLVAVAWTTGGTVAAFIMAILIPAALLFSFSMGKAADKGDCLHNKEKKGR